jgi:broad specificity phosphatase PhoE
MPLLSMIIAGLVALASAGTPVYVMRHLDTQGGERDPALLPSGQQAAARLARSFGNAPPRTILITDFRRTRETVAPLARRLGITPLVYDPADMPGLVARVRASPGPVLVVGHSNTVPDIITALGGQAPPPIQHDEFGEIWRINPDGATSMRRIAPAP